jgi:glutathione S-transferase
MPSPRCEDREAIFADQVADRIDELTDAMHVVAREARTIEGRLSKEQWIVGANYSATDMVIFPWIQLLRRALTDARRRGTRRALPADGAKLSGAGALDPSHRIASRLRANLSASLARERHRPKRAET